MPVSRDCLVEKSNELIAGTNDDLELLQLSGVAESNTVFSVSTLNDLPDASLNKGRFIYVESIGAYRFSDGLEWTNDYDIPSLFGKLYAWGNNSTGQLSDGTTIRRSSPVQEVTSSTNWCQVSACLYSLGIKNSGTLWGWGFNDSGQLGDGTYICRSSPVQEISSSTDWRQVSAGHIHSLALKTSGELYAWGCNINGQIGSGVTISCNSPVQEVTSSTDWCQVSNGCHSVALKKSGTLWAWGLNNIGQVGDGTIFCHSSPVQETSCSTNWCQVSAGRNTSLALKTSGELYAWGENICGGLGDETTINRSSPVQEITSSTNWCQVYASFRHSVALKTSGEVWSWGWNDFIGALGDSTTTDKSSPVQEISSSTDWCQVSAGGYHTLALKTSGTLWSWGYNVCGQISDGTTTVRRSPVQEITSSSDWSYAEGGEYHAIAIKYES